MNLEKWRTIVTQEQLRAQKAIQQAMADLEKAQFDSARAEGALTLLDAMEAYVETPAPEPEEQPGERI